ncbi:MAG: hypothetical protein NTX76_03610 [Alphaproteobacteria bacterium]|nr:hypothetical protein [Alphaproteobacteria bacterium]
MNFLARLTLLLLVTSTIGHTASIYNFGLLERVGMAIGRRMIDFVDHREWASSIKSDNGQYSLDFINKTHERFLNEELLNSSLITGLFIDCVDPIEDANRLTNPLVAALRNPSVTTVGLWNVQFTDESATAIAEALRHNTTLTELSFFACKNIGPMGEAIGDLLRREHLTQLYLNWTPINTPSAIAIAESLQTNQSLRSLYIMKNGLDIDDTNKIARSIKDNTTLTELHFGANLIGTEELMFIANMLEHNPKLLKLTLCGHRVELDYIKRIASMLAINTSLLELNIQNNAIDNETGIMILNAITDHNMTVQCLKVEGGNLMDENIEQAISAAIERNKNGKSYEEGNPFSCFDFMYKTRHMRGRGKITFPVESSFLNPK